MFLLPRLKKKRKKKKRKKIKNNVFLTVISEMLKLETNRFEGFFGFVGFFLNSCF